MDRKVAKERERQTQRESQTDRELNFNILPTAHGDLITKTERSNWILASCQSQRVHITTERDRQTDRQTDGRTDRQRRGELERVPKSAGRTSSKVKSTNGQTDGYMQTWQSNAHINLCP